MTDPRYAFNERLGCHEFYPDPCPEPSLEPPDDEEYDPFEIDEYPHWQEVADEAKELGV